MGQWWKKPPVDAEQQQQPGTAQHQVTTEKVTRMSDSDSDSDSDRTRTGLGQKKSKSSKIKKFIMKQFDKTNDKIEDLADLILEDLHYRKVERDSDSDDDDDDNDVDKGDCTGEDDCRCWICESYRQETEVDEDEEEDENEVVVEKVSRVMIAVTYYDSSDDDDDSNDSDDGTDDSDWTDEDFIETF